MSLLREIQEAAIDAKVPLAVVLRKCMVLAARLGHEPFKMNRTFRAGYNRKRIRRLMRMHGLMLPPRVHRRHGRPHLGQVQQPTSNQRWCSDIFLIPC